MAHSAKSLHFKTLNQHRLTNLNKSTEFAMGAKGPINRQILSSICGNLLTVSYGSSNGWATANFLELQKLGTRFPSGPLSLKEATLVVSIYFIGGFFGNLAFPYIVQKYGSKKAMLAIGFPQIISWLLIIYAQNIYYLYTSRIIAGVVGAAQLVCITIFVSDISDDKIRGSLNSLFDPAYNIGTLLGFVLANYFDYVSQAKCHLILPIVYEILFARIPQSPQYLVNIQKQEAAKRSYKFFKGTEFEKFPLDEKAKAAHDSELTLNDFVCRRARKSILITLPLVILNSLQGFTILITYVTEIFAHTNSNLTAIESSIIITSLLILGNLIVYHLIDRAGRRRLYVCSSFATSLALAFFAAYLYFFADSRAYEWAPIVSISFIIFFSCLGMTPVPFILMIEIFPQKIQHYGVTAYIAILWAIGFFMSEAYPPIKACIGLFGWISFFAIASLCNALFGIFILPETKGKSHEAIMQLLD